MVSLRVDVEQNVHVLRQRVLSWRLHVGVTEARVVGSGVLLIQHRGVMVAHPPGLVRAHVHLRCYCWSAAEGYVFMWGGSVQSPRVRARKRAFVSESEVKSTSPGSGSGPAADAAHLRTERRDRTSQR